MHRAKRREICLSASESDKVELPCNVGCELFIESFSEVPGSDT